jgi:hypothetical protein
MLHLSLPHSSAPITLARSTINTAPVTSPQIANPANTTFPTREQAVIHVEIINILAMFEKLAGYLLSVVTLMEPKLVL